MQARSILLMYFARPSMSVQRVRNFRASVGGGPAQSDATTFAVTTRIWGHLMKLKSTLLAAGLSIAAAGSAFAADSSSSSTDVMRLPAAGEHAHGHGWSHGEL
jgi:hypothetical protein